MSVCPNKIMLFEVSSFAAVHASFRGCDNTEIIKKDSMIALMLPFLIRKKKKKYLVPFSCSNFAHNDIYG